MESLSLNGNYIDLIIIIILVFFISEAWRYGFWVILADFLGFLLSLVIALKGYAFAAGFLRSNFSLPNSVANALGFMVVASLTEAFLGFLFAEAIRKIPYKFWKKPWSSIAAIVPALGQGLVIVSFISTLVIGLPIRPQVKKDISESKIGSVLVKQTTSLESRLNEIFGGLAEDSLTYLTVKPGSGERIPITSKDEGLKVDEATEREMVNLVNQERRKAGVKELTVRTELIPVARAHAEDMWKRNYFGHVSPEGNDVANRLDKAKVSYSIAGENLALAPTLQTAHNGLMNSEGHRRNILDPEFKRIGIGVIENGYYGKMFVQVFTD